MRERSTTSRYDGEDSAPERTWWVEGWHLYARTVRQFFFPRRILTLLMVVAAAAVIGGLAGVGIAALADDPRLSAGTLVLMLAAAAGAASLVIALGVCYVRDVRGDGLAWSPLPLVISELQKAPVPDGYFVDAETKDLVVAHVRRRRRSLTVAISVLLLIGAVDAVLVVPMLPAGGFSSTPIVLGYQAILFLAGAIFAVRSLAQTTNLLDHTFGGAIPDVSISARPAASDPHPEETA